MKLSRPRTLHRFDELSHELPMVARLAMAGRCTDGNDLIEAAQRLDTRSESYIGPVETWEIRSEEGELLFDLWLFWGHSLPGGRSETYGAVFEPASEVWVASVSQSQLLLAAIAPCRARFQEAFLEAARAHPDTHLRRAGLDCTPDEDYELECYDASCPHCGAEPPFPVVDAFTSVTCGRCGGPLWGGISSPRQDQP